MGQYYKAVLVDHEWFIQTIQPSGYKMLEHAYYWNETMKRVEKLLLNESYNVMWIGDYSEVWSLVWKHKFPNEEDRNYENPYKESELLERIEWYSYYLINKSKKEFINMTKQQENYDKSELWWLIHPLPILCKTSWEYSWWDYRPNMQNWEYIGNWCGDIITIYIRKNDTDLSKELKAQEYEDMTDIYIFKEY